MTKKMRADGGCARLPGGSARYTSRSLLCRRGGVTCPLSTSLSDVFRIFPRYLLSTSTPFALAARQKPFCVDSGDFFYECIDFLARDRVTLASTRGAAAGAATAGEGPDGASGSCGLAPVPAAF